MTIKFVAPDFVTAIVPSIEYRRWLDRKAQAHCQRDRERGNTTATKAAYKEAIHAAVLQSKGHDAYTGEALDWHLIGQYDNDLSRAGGRQFKGSFARLPTVDHVGDGLGQADFLICGWAVNDAKHDLPVDLFLELCQKVIRHLRPEA